MELFLETSQIPQLICFSFNLNSSFLRCLPNCVSFLGNVEHFERTWRIICGRNDEYSGSIPTFSRSFCMPEKVKVFLKKAAVTTGLDGTRFACLDPDVGMVCVGSQCWESRASRRFSSVVVGVCLCSPSPSLSRRTLTAWWYSLSTLPNLHFY